MIQLAIYGKGGIGKSTISANVSYLLSEMGMKVLQIGCDPKHDSTRLLLNGKAQRTVLEYIRDTAPYDRRLEDVVCEGENGILCVEAGGPEPGIGCAEITASYAVMSNFTMLRLPGDMTAERFGYYGMDRYGAAVRMIEAAGDGFTPEYRSLTGDFYLNF